MNQSNSQIPKHLQIKRENHYVWGRYVKSWESTKENYVWHTSKNRKIVYDSIRSILKERDFYKYRNLTNEHLKIINIISSQSPKELQKLHFQLLQTFLKLQELKNRYKFIMTKDQSILKHISAFENNIIEDLHSTYENGVFPILDSLKNHDFTVLDNNANQIKFMAFLGHQMARTKTFKEMCIDSISNKRIKTLHEEAWWLISHIYGLNLGKSFYNSYFGGERHCMLINETDEEFITSDNPIINVYETLNENDLKITLEHECDYFYAISPRLGYMINKSDRFNSGVNYVSKEFVQEINIKLAIYSSKHIISTNSEQLDKYKKYVGKRLKVIRN